jgi:hypothetical protein
MPGAEGELGMAGPHSYVECLRALLRETEHLREAAADADWEQVVSCLDARQALMTQIDALPATALPEAAASLARSLLHEVMRLDEETAPRVLATLEHTRSSIEESRLTRSTIDAYRRATHTETGPSRFIDKQR